MFPYIKTDTFMKRIVYSILALLSLGVTSCSDFLDTVPHDQLSPATTWKNADEVDKFLVTCYQGWGNLYTNVLYMDAASDIAYNNFSWEGGQMMGNGLWTATSPGNSLYDFWQISACNNVVDNIDKAKISDDKVKNNLLGQALAIRAFTYMNMNFWYGGVPIIEHQYQNAEAAKVPRNTEAEVWDYFDKDIDRAITLLNDRPAARGRIAKGAALAIKMRAHLYRGNWQKAADAAQEIIALGQYELDPSYAKIFTLEGKNSKEIIVGEDHEKSKHSLYTIGQFYNNGDGSWSSVVPTQHLVEIYPMEDGLPQEDSPLYDATHPFNKRDPRMAMSILYPGCDYWGGVYNTLDKVINGKNNTNFPEAADNASKTGLTWAKYTAPLKQYDDMWSADPYVILFRYAEVLLTRAEALNELNGPSAEVYNLIDQLRTRVGMPAVDRTRYATKDALREVIHRERTVELAGEGFRRADIVRWKDTSGQMLAMKVLNETLTRISGTIAMNAATAPGLRCTVSGNRIKIEDRLFKPTFRYFPIPQSAIDRNPKLKQNDGY